IGMKARRVVQPLGERGIRPETVLVDRDRPGEERRGLLAAIVPLEQERETLERGRLLAGIGRAHPIVARDHLAEELLERPVVATTVEDRSELFEQLRKRRIALRRRGLRGLD